MLQAWISCETSRCQNKYAPQPYLFSTKMLYQERGMSTMLQLTMHLSMHSVYTINPHRFPDLLTTLYIYIWIFEETYCPYCGYSIAQQRPNSNSTICLGILFVGFSRSYERLLASLLSLLSRRASCFSKVCSLRRFLACSHSERSVPGECGP